MIEKKKIRIAQVIRISRVNKQTIRMRASISGIAGSNVINEEESHQEWKEVEVLEIPKVSNLRLYGDVE